MNASTLAFLTFLLAMAGYAGLTALVLASAGHRAPTWLLRADVLAVTLHVFLVWAYRYRWQLGQATRNGWTGFLVFHAALLLLWAAAARAGPRGVHLLRAAFLVVTAGAIGAVFRYAEVALYRLPVLLCAAAGGVGLVLAWRRRGAAHATQAGAGSVGSGHGT